MRAFKQGLVALASVGLLASGGAAFSHASATKTAASATPAQCAMLDDALDSSIARGPSAGPGHDALVHAETVALRAQGCPLDNPTLTTSVSADSVAVGTPIHDTATITGDTPTGQIGFHVWIVAPGHTCRNSGPGTPVRPVANVHGNGSYTSGNFVPSVPGTYAFGAYYTGDANNPHISSACEPFTVTGGTR